MYSTRIVSAKRLLLLFVPIVPLILFWNSQRTNVVTLFAEYPMEVIAGASFPVTVTIEKGNLDGFGRYSHELPEGFYAECNAQNFEFVDNTVKLLWVNLPYSNSFTFTYTVHVPEDYKGKMTIAAKFGYVIDNERRFAELIPQNIKVVNDPIALRKFLAEQERSQKSVNPTDITCYRDVSILGNEALVSIRVNKSHMKNMCKIEELLPQGYSFYAVDREGAAFSSQNNVARFMWVEAPAKEIFIVSYKVMPNSGYNINDLFISGAFSYLDNENTHSITILERDQNAVSESSGNSFTTTLSPDYNADYDENLATSKDISASPKSTYYSENKEYINKDALNGDLNSNSAQVTGNSITGSNSLATTPSSKNYSNPELYNFDDPEELKSELRKNDFNEEQVNFFSSSQISAQGKPVGYNNANSLNTNSNSVNAQTITNNSVNNNNIYSQPGSVAYNQTTANKQVEVQRPENFNSTLNSTGAKTVPTNNQAVAVNINAIPAPSTYFGQNTHNPNVVDLENPNMVTNPSYLGEDNISAQEVSNKNYNSNSSVAYEANNSYNTNNNYQTPAYPSSSQIQKATVASSSAEQSFQNSLDIPSPKNGNAQTQYVAVNPQTETLYSSNESTVTTSGQFNGESQFASGGYYNGANSTNATYKAGNGANSSNNLTSSPTSVSNNKTTNTQVASKNSSIAANSSTSSVNVNSAAQSQNVINANVTQGSKSLNTNTSGVKTLQTKTVSATNSNASTIANSQPTAGTSQNFASNSNNNNTNAAVKVSASSIITNQKTVSTQNKTVSSNQTVSSNFASNKQTQKSVNTVITDKEPEAKQLVYSPQEKEVKTTRLSDKNDKSQKDTKITRINEEKGGKGVYFRIQISASHKLVDTKTHFTRHKVLDNVIVEKLGKWFKYTIQKYNTYKSARNYRNNIWKNTAINDAFVVAYNGPKRITVQEALMITNQQWYK